MSSDVAEEGESFPSMPFCLRRSRRGLSDGRGRGQSRHD